MEKEAGVLLSEAVNSLPEDSRWKGRFEKWGAQFPEATISELTLSDIRKGANPKKGEVFREVANGEGKGSTHESVASLSLKADHKYGLPKSHRAKTSRSVRRRW
ncbi:MAG: hypothetical protein ABIB61_00815 [Candidatus Shapirobacteria bacterium]